MARSRFLIGKVLLIGLCAVLVVHAQPVGQPQSRWKIAVVLATDAGEKNADGPLLWLGIKNESDSARMICQVSGGYGVFHRDYQNGGAEGSPHNCSGRVAYDLVLARETRFLAMPIRQKDLQQANAELSIDLRLAEAAFPSFDEKRDFRLAWKGTVREALEAARSRR